MKKLLVILVTAFALVPVPGYSVRSIVPKKLTGTEHRLALVIGNGDYKSAPLKNPVNDAADITVALRKVGFKVIHKQNATHKVMEKAVRSFGKKLRRTGGVGLFYFAGHGMQVNGKNYLIPVDAEIESDSDVQFEAVDAGRILGKMEDAENNVNIVILDACRNNPLNRSFRSANTGLAKMVAPAGSLIAYATSPGSVASDGDDDKNGIYTKHFLKNIHTPGIKIEEVFKLVRMGVARDTINKQITWESSSLIGDFYFNNAPATILASSKPEEKQQGKNTKLKPSASQNAELKKARLNASRQKQFKALITDIKNYKATVKSATMQAAKNAAWEAISKKHSIWSAGTKPGEVNRLLSQAYLTISDENQDLIAMTISAGLEIELINSSGMKFIYIKPGTFQMGSYNGEDDERPVHDVVISKGFFMQTTEATQAQWRFVMGSNPSSFKYCGDDCPVETVSWLDAQTFIKRLNKQNVNMKYRLPKEAEWEYACRAESTTKYCFGSDNISLDDFAWYRNNSENMTHPVATKKPNAFGLFDMHGNVYEWCQDWYSRSYTPAQTTDPEGALSGSYRVNRGGSYDDFARFSRSSLRYGLLPSERRDLVGVRLVAMPGQQN